MKSLLFGDHRSPHVHRWSEFLEAVEVEVFTVGYGESHAPDTYSYRKLLDRSGRTATLWGKLRSFLDDLLLIRKENPDFLSVHFLTARYAALMLLSARPSILSCWGSDILIDMPASRGFSRLIRRAALRKATHITCDSDEVRNAIVSEVPGSEARISLVFWGIDLSKFCVSAREEYSARAIREELALPPSAIVLLSNRLASPNYRIKELIERFRASIRSVDTHLVVRFQPGAESGYVQSCKEAAAGDERIHYLERPLADAEMPALYAACDAALHFPLSDATPVSMLEAFASGCAVICSDALDSYKVLENDYHILRLPLAELDDKGIETALNLRSRYAEADAGIVRRLHSREKTVETLRTIIAKLKLYGNRA
ncbi:MAG: glycosyltransferase family 4 protein [Rectinemataceae bacterium]|nr:glycosyltransferase family 4 protein [Rectinemataceae bacterium]